MKANELEKLGFEYIDELKEYYLQIARYYALIYKNNEFIFDCDDCAFNQKINIKTANDIKNIKKYFRDETTRI
jgi:hypothetical protein